MAIIDPILTPCVMSLSLTLTNCYGITQKCVTITKTRLCNFDPLKPHFYILKWGLQGYTLFFLFLLKT